MGKKRGNGEGTIYKRKSDGMYVASVSLGYDAQGKRRRKYLYGTTRRAVAEQLQKALKDKAEGKFLSAMPDDVSKQTVAQYLTTWLENVHRPTVRPNTYGVYERTFRLYVNPVVGHLKLAALTPQHIALVMKKITQVDPERRRTRTNGAPVSGNTVNIYINCLQRALDQAVKWGLLSFNPARAVTLPHVDRHRPNMWSPDDARAFLEIVRGTRYHALFATMLSLGLRRGEALALLWEDIDLDHATLHVRGNLQVVNGQYLVGDPKSRASMRWVTLPQSMVKMLKSHQAEQVGEALAVGDEWVDTGYVFTTRIGLPHSPSQVSDYFHKIVKRSTLPYIRLHDLRHSCASFLLAAGVTPRVIMQVLGHSNIATTMNIYAHVLPSLTDEAATKMDTLLWGSPAQQKPAE